MSFFHVDMKINQFYVDYRSEKMEARNFLFLILINILVINSYGFDLKGKSPVTPEDCMRPPSTKQDRRCCKLPKERIWGDLRQSLQLCLKRMKLDLKPMRQEMADDGSEMITAAGSDTITSTENPGELSSITNTSPSTYSTTPGHFNHHGRPHRKKSFLSERKRFETSIGRQPYASCKMAVSERFKELFSSVYKEIKNTFRVFWQSVVLITDHLHRNSNDSCFMECVFEDQGFLLNKVVNKVALLKRLSETLGENEPWHKVAITAVEICYQTEMATPSNETCRSGSDKVFRCIFRQIFLNCPNWAQNEYCTSLKEFYQKCPNGPPPEINDNQPTAPPSLEDDIGKKPTTENEEFTNPE